MEQMRKVVYGALALMAVGAALAFGPGAARADDGASANSTGGATLDPAFQIGNAQGDHGQ